MCRTADSLETENGNGERRENKAAEYSHFMRIVDTKEKMRADMETGGRGFKFTVAVLRAAKSFPSFT